MAGAFFLALFAFASTALAALIFPALTGRVVDEAGILDTGTQAALTAKLAALEAKSTDQLVVVTLKSLQGTSIEDFGVQLGRAWKIGQKDKNNGVLLIVAPAERKVRIEVGYGLEGTLTDAISKLIIENSIIPRFRANDIPGGITRGVDDIISALTDNDEWKQRAGGGYQFHSAQGWAWLAVFLLFGSVALVILFVFHDIARRPSSGRRSGQWTVGRSGWVPPVSSGSGGGFSGGGGGGGFSGGGGSFGGGGASGSW